MTTPTIPQRRLLAAGVCKSFEDWGTADELAAGSGLLLESDGGLVRNQPYLPAIEADTPFPLEGDLGPIGPVDFAPAFTMRYDPGALGVLLASLFGTSSNPPVLTSGGYLHTARWLSENYGEYVTFVIERASKILEVPSAKVHMLDLNIADGLLKGTIGLRGNTVINTGQENEATEMDALTYKDRGNRVKFSDLTVYMNTQATASQPDADAALEVSDISMHFERPHDGLHKAGSQQIIEPMENAHPIVTITLTFPRMNAINNAYFADFIAETEKKAYIKFENGAIPGQAALFTFFLYFPRLRIINIDYPFDEIVPATITLQAEEAASNPTGFLYTIPYYRLLNTRTTGYLA